MSGKRNWGNWRRDGHEPPPIAEGAVKVPSRFWKTKYDCKRNKGDHTFEIDRIWGSSWHQEKDGTWRQPNWRYSWDYGYFVDWRCTACKKKKYERLPLGQKSFDKFRHTINEKTTTQD